MKRQIFEKESIGKTVLKTAPLGGDGFVIFFTDDTFLFLAEKFVQGSVEGNDAYYISGDEPLDFTEYWNEVTRIGLLTFDELLEFKKKKSAKVL